MNAEHKDHYVYALYRPDSFTPFYIGKGREKRMQSHTWRSRAGKTPKDMVLRELFDSGHKPKMLKLVINLTNDEAFNFEKAFIANIGRHPNGPLANVSAGGYGVSGHKQSEEHKAKRFASLNKFIAENPQHCAAISARTKGVPKSPEAIAKVANALRGRKQSPEYVESRISKIRGKKHTVSRSPEYIENMKKAQLKFHEENPQARELARIKATGKKRSEESKKKGSAASLAAWARRKAEKQDIT